MSGAVRRNRLSDYLLASIILLSTISCALFVATPAYAFCGFEDHELNSEREFADKYPGNLAVHIESKYLVLRRDRCAEIGHIDTRMRIFINHLNLTDVSEPAFVAVHVALFDPKDLRNIIYLFRNAKGNTTKWTEDSSGRKYSSLPDKTHTEFNSDLDLSREQFDSKYHEGKRKWNDRINNGDSTYDTWDARSNFKIGNELFAAINGHHGGLRVQNYFISFTTGDKDRNNPLANAPSFSLDAAGAKCILIRVAGSSNISSSVNGEYTLAFNGTKTCDSVFSNLLGIGFFEWLFGYRN